MDATTGSSSTPPRPVPGSVEQAILQALKRLHQSLDEAEARLSQPGKAPPPKEEEAPVERHLYVGVPRAFRIPEDRPEF